MDVVNENWLLSIAARRDVRDRAGEDDAPDAAIR
jgi:hypothetical protein